MKIGKIWIATVICGVLISCGPSSDELTAEERYAVDTIFSKQLISYKREADSLCKSIQSSYYARAVDSIKTQYKEEINALMGIQNSSE